MGLFGARAYQIMDEYGLSDLSSKDKESVRAIIEHLSKTAGMELDAISYFVPDNPLVDVPSRILNRLENSLDVNDVYRNKQGQSSDEWLENGYRFQLSLSVVSSEIWTYFDVEPVLLENP